MLLHVSDKAMTLYVPRGPIKVLDHINAACLLGLPGQPMEANSWPPKMLQNGHCAITKHESKQHPHSTPPPPTLLVAYTVKVKLAAVFLVRVYVLFRWCRSPLVDDVTVSRSVH